MRLAGFLAAAPLLSFSGPSPAKEGEGSLRFMAVRYLDEGIGHYRKGNLDFAADSLSQAIASDGSMRTAYAARALVHHALGDGELEEKDLDSAGDFNTDSARDLVVRANMRVLQERYDEAARDVEAAFSKERGRSDAFLARGRIYKAKGEWIQALSDFSEAARRDPQCAMCLFNAAHAQRQLGEHDAAVDLLVKALRVNPEFPLPYGLLGLIFAEKRDEKRAIAAYSKAIGLHPDYSYAYSGRAAAKMAAGDSAGGLKDHAEAIRTAPDQAAPYMERAEALSKLGKREQALADLRQAAKLEPRDIALSIKLARKLAAAGAAHDAASVYGRCLKRASKFPASRRDALTTELLLARAQIYAPIDREKAFADLDRAVGIGDRPTAALAARARLLNEINETEDAEADLAQALKHDPGYAPALLLKAEMASASGRNQEAIDLLDALVEKSKTPEVLLARARLRLKDRDGAGALADAESAAALAPDDPEARLVLGLVHRKRLEFRRAIAAFNAALDLGAPASAALQERALAHGRLGDRRAALKDAAAAIEAGRLPSAYAALGEIHLMAFDPDQALAAAAIPDRPDPRLLLVRGRARALKRDWGSALTAIEESAELRGEAGTFAELCRVLRVSGQVRQALTACGRAIELDEDLKQAHVDRGLAHLALGENEKAMFDLYDARRLGSRDASAELARSAAHAILGQHRESNEAYRAAMELRAGVQRTDSDYWGRPNPTGRDYHSLIFSVEAALLASNDPLALVVRANALHNAGFYDRAIVDYSKAIELDGSLSAAYTGRCAALASQASFEPAEQDCRRGVELSQDPEPKIQLIALLSHQRRHAEALEAAQQALGGQQSRNPTILAQAGSIRYALKDHAAAEASFRSALEADPHSAESYNGIGLIRAAQGRTADAIEEFSRAIALEPSEERYYRNRAMMYASLKDSASAAADYKTAMAFAPDPKRTAEYKKLIESAGLVQ